MSKRILMKNEISEIFVDPREFWNSLSKYEVTKDFEDHYGVSGSDALGVGIVAFEKDVAYGQIVETKQKTVGGDKRIDGIFDLRVKNATFARLTTKEKSETFTPIEFVNKNGVFELEGCDLDHPFFLPHDNGFTLIEKFKVETDGETIQYRQFVMSPKILKRFFKEIIKLCYFPSIFGNERVILTDRGSQLSSYTFQLNESREFDLRERKSCS